MCLISKIEKQLFLNDFPSLLSAPVENCVSIMTHRAHTKLKSKIIGQDWPDQAQVILNTVNIRQAEKHEYGNASSIASHDSQAHPNSAESKDGAAAV